MSLPAGILLISVSPCCKQQRYPTLSVRVEASNATRGARGWVFTKGVDDVESECALDGREWDFVIHVIITSPCICPMHSSAMTNCACIDLALQTGTLRRQRASTATIYVAMRHLTLF